MEQTVDFLFIKPEDLQGYWPIIKEGLEKVAKHGDHWIPEDIYAVVKTGNANLHIGYSNGYAGFIISQQVQAYDGPVLHIWAAYSEKENLLESGMVHFREWAKNINARRITFDSPRKGWKKVGEKLGFKPATIKYELRL